MRSFPRVKLRWCVAAAALAVCVAQPATAGATYSSTPGDRVVGLGVNNPAGGGLLAGFAMDARSGPNGENPFGAAGFALTTGPTDFHAGLIQCLRVSGSYATMVYKVKWTYPLRTQDAVRVWVHDLGKPSYPWKPGLDKVRNQIFNSASSPSLLSCPDPASPAEKAFVDATNPLTAGDVKVIDQ